MSYIFTAGSSAIRPRNHVDIEARSRQQGSIQKYFYRNRFNISNHTESGPNLLATLNYFYQRFEKEFLDRCVSGVVSWMVKHMSGI